MRVRVCVRCVCRVQVTSASEDLQPAAEAVGARYDDEAFDAEQGVAASPDKPLQYEVG